MGVTWVVLLLAVAAAAVLAARPLLARLQRSGRDRLGGAAYGAFRELVPLPAPTLRTVTRRITTACRRQRIDLPFGRRTILPDRFDVAVSPAEYDALAGYVPLVEDAVADALVAAAKQRDWSLAGRPVVRIDADVDAVPGRPLVRARSAAVPAAGPAQPPARPAVQPVPGRYPAGAGPARGDVGAVAEFEPTARLAAEATSRLAAEPTSRAAEPTALAAEPTAVSTRHLFTALAGEAQELGPVVVERALTIGRNPDCDVVVDYPSASRRHVRLEPAGSGCRVVDLGSTHGSFVDGRRITEPVVLSAGQAIRIGRAGPAWVYRPS